jgi:hypothetical protein
MTHLPELIAAYAGMTPWARAKLLDAALDFLRNWPLPQKKPLLTLVKRAAKVDISPSRIDSLVNQELAILVGESVDSQ